jgi:hypothetical protein
LSAVVYEYQVAPPPDALEVLFSDSDNTIARSKDVMFQVRVGTMTHQRLAAIEQAVRLSRAQHGGVLGALIVMEDTAEVPPPDVRVAQRALVEDLLAESGVRVGIVIPGRGVKSMLLRTVLRTGFAWSRTVKISSTVEEGAQWIAEGSNGALQTAALAALGERVREIAQQPRRSEL